jgi:hypothetical protein
MSKLAAPFPYFGGKRRVADLVWQRFGDVKNYVEPFFGSGAVMLGSPWPSDRIETVNDADGFVINFWRAVKADPATVAYWADDIVAEADLHAKHLWLLEQGEGLAERLQGDPDYYDPKIAGWWVWGMSGSIGSNWCTRNGPWIRERDTDGFYRLVRTSEKSKGIKRAIPYLKGKGQGINRHTIEVYRWFRELSARLRRVRVTCGDWSRVLGESITWAQGLTGVFLDPPYASDRYKDIYSNDSLTIAPDVRSWALEAGKNKLMRIALCGHAGEHDLPGWDTVPWKANGGYGLQSDKRGRENRDKEVIWFSPYCLAGEIGLGDEIDLGGEA